MKADKPIKNRYKGALREGSENYLYGGEYYMYGGEYANGGEVAKYAGSAAYGALEGVLDTVTFGLTDPLTDIGYDALQKAGNKKLDLSDPEDLKQLEKQNKLRGAGNIGGAIAGGVVTGNVPGAIKTGVEGANVIVQNSDVSDKTRQIANTATNITGTVAGFAGAGVGSAGESALDMGLANLAKDADQLGTFTNIAKGAQVGGQAASLIPNKGGLAEQARAIQAEEARQKEMLAQQQVLLDSQDSLVAAGIMPNTVPMQYYGSGGKLGNKIGKLRREGYPQDQAVAIAYSMQKRNKLEDGGPTMLPTVEVTADKYTGEDINKAYPYYNTLSAEERKLFRDSSPIGAQIRSRARNGQGVNTATMDAAGTALLNQLNPITALQAPQSLMVEGVEALRGNEYNFANALQADKQRLPSETMGFETTDDMSWYNPNVVGNFAMDMMADPTNVVGAGLLKNPAKAGLKQAGKYLTEETALRNAYKLNPKALKEAQETMLVRARPVGQNPYANMAEQMRAKEAAGEQLKWYQKNLLNPQTNPYMAAREKYYGQWFADNPSELDFYINPNTRNFADHDQIELLKTRMPKSEAAQYSVKNFDDAKQLSNLHDSEYILPKDMVQSLERFPIKDLGKLQQEYKQMNTPHWWKGYELSEISKKAMGGDMDTDPKTYTVSDADKTFYGIANKLGINKQDFVDANPDVNIDRIKPGMVLNMPLAMPTPVKDALPQSVAAELLLRQAFKESSFIPTAESPKQYKGLGQIGDAVLTDYMTATGMKDIDLFNPEQNMAIQKWYMDDLYNRDFIKKEGVDQLDDIRLAKALAAYNWGPTYLSNFLNAKKSKGQDIYKSFDWVEDLPTETRDYVHKILLKDIPSFEEEYANALADQQYKDIITLYIPDYFKRDIQPAAFNIDSVPNKNDFLIRPNPVDNTAVSMPVEKLSRGGWLSKYEMGGNIQDNTYSQGGWLNKYK